MHLAGATGRAELRTIKWLQGWSRFGYTFFLSVLPPSGSNGPQKLSHTV